MGAVFTLFSAFYYWYPFITNKYYDEILASTHFLLLFIGANLTFGPMHFLGMAGMPRRILDYPDMYLKFNNLASMGALISFISIFVFISALSKSYLVILPYINNISLDLASIKNRYNHLHNFNTIPVINHI